MGGGGGVTVTKKDVSPLSLGMRMPRVKAIYRADRKSRTLTNLTEKCFSVGRIA